MKNTEIIILAAGVFLAVTLILVSLLLWARKKLAPGGRVKIKINDDRILDVDSGSSLLSTLGSEKIFLPSACGGQGTCGMCKCRVISGRRSRTSYRNAVFYAWTDKGQLASGMPGQSAFGHGHTRTRRDFRYKEMGVRSSVQLQRSHFHKSFRSQAPGGGKP